MPTVQLPAFDKVNTVAVLTLEQDNRVLAENTSYFAAPKELALPSPELAVSVQAYGSGYLVKMTSPVFARAVQVDFGEVDAKPDDSFFDLLPNETRSVHVTSVASLQQLRAALTLRSLADATKP